MRGFPAAVIQKGPAPLTTPSPAGEGVKCPRLIDKDVRRFTRY
jgi:hypothetical protein